jgi:predicted dithiol-disulfide oxidoreductase (DUF899 family)
MANPKVASREEWLQARKALLIHEKEETQLRDRNAAERLALPWVEVDKAYTFDTPSGRKTLAELFDGRGQLVIYHFMLPPEWEAGCPGCSFLADHLDGTLPHLNHHDVTLIVVSRAPLDKIAAYKARMGWKFPWVSSFDGDFNYDYGVSFSPETIAAGATYNFEPVGADAGEAPGLSAFYKDETGQVFHTYSSYARAGEELIGTYMILDRAPLGRNESGNMGDWMRRHDEYEDAAPAKACHAEAVPA